MRLSTSMLYDAGMRGIQRPQSEQLDLQQKIASGRRVLKPSDDPIAAAAVIGLQQSKAVNTQYSVNAENAASGLNLELEALGEATSIMQDIKELVVKAGNPILQNSDRQSIATEVKGLYDQLLGVANRTDGDGKYMFAGFHTASQPFAESSPGVVTYSGDDEQRLIQIGPQRRMPVGDSGVDVFLRMKEGNGTFVTNPGAANTGSASSGPGVVRNMTGWNASSQQYSIRFHSTSATPPVTTYDIVDTAANVSMLTGAAPAAGPYARTFTPGGSIDLQRQAGDPIATAFDAGVQVEIAGNPATNDTFTIGAAQTKDVFATVHDFITTLNTPLSPAASAKAGYQSDLNLISSSIDRAMDQVLTTRAAVGIRLTELDTVMQTSEDMNLHYSEDLSRLQDVDYAQALSDLAQRQFSLEAAQKSFVAVTSLKLFDFI